MSLFKGGLTARRYRVIGEVPSDFRTSYQTQLEEFSFHEPTSALHDGESSGWTQIHNLLDTDFSDINKWLYNHYLVASLRVDKKVLPGKLFAAHLDKRCQGWCRSNGKERCPARVKAELKETLTQEMLLKTLPRVQTFEFCWNIVDGYVLFLSTSESANDRFRTLFRNTFNIVLAPFSPLDFLADQPEIAAALESQGISDYRPSDQA
jgi:DNA recombination-dependent growth factor C